MNQVPRHPLTRRSFLALAGAAALGESGCRHDPPGPPNPVRAFAAIAATIDWVEIPAGQFLYGDYKVPVNLPAFWIMRHQVTVKQYRAYCAASLKAMPPEPRWGWHDDHPIVNVTWHDCIDFCRLAGLDLPTERQWEKAARGVDGRLYAWGNQFDPVRCVSSVPPTKHNSTVPIGQLAAGLSPFGVDDTAGNVLEWCSDKWDPDHEWRVLRGGSWADTQPLTLRVTFRDRCDPGASYPYQGFRCVRNTRPPRVQRELL